MGRRLDKHFTEEEHPMAKKQKRKWSMSLTSTGHAPHRPELLNDRGKANCGQGRQWSLGPLQGTVHSPPGSSTY